MIPACPATPGTHARRVAEAPAWLRHEGAPAPCDRTHQTPPGPPSGRTTGIIGQALCGTRSRPAHHPPHRTRKVSPRGKRRRPDRPGRDCRHRRPLRHGQVEHVEGRGRTARPQLPGHRCAVPGDHVVDGHQRHRHRRPARRRRRGRQARDRLRHRPGRPDHHGRRRGRGRTDPHPGGHLQGQRGQRRTGGPRPDHRAAAHHRRRRAARHRRRGPRHRHHRAAGRRPQDLPHRLGGGPRRPPQRRAEGRRRPRHPRGPDQAGRRDSSRKTSPLAKAGDAVEVDTTALSLPQVIECVVTLVEEKRAGK